MMAMTAWSAADWGCEHEKHRVAVEGTMQSRHWTRGAVAWPESRRRCDHNSGDLGAPRACRTIKALAQHQLNDVDVNGGNDGVGCWLLWSWEDELAANAGELAGKHGRGEV